MIRSSAPTHGRRAPGAPLAVLTLCLPFCAPVALAQDKLPPAEELLDRFVEASGGKAAFEKVHNRISKGTIEMSIGVKGPFTLWQSEPCKHIIQVDAEGVGKILEGTDGEVAWAISPLDGARIKEGVERAEAIRQAWFNGELHWRRLYKKVETLGLENVGEKPAYKVELTPDLGKPVTIFLDKDSGLAIKHATIADTPMGEIADETTISDYKQVDGHMLPHKLVQTVMQQNTTFLTESVEHNANIPKTKFELPVEIRQLQEKSKPGGG